MDANGILRIEMKKMMRKEVVYTDSLNEPENML